MATVLNQKTGGPVASLELLERMIEDIDGELELEPLLNRIVSHACRLTGARDGAIGLYDPQRKVVRIAAHNLPPDAIAKELDEGSGLAGPILRTGKPLLCRYGDLEGIAIPGNANHWVLGMPIHWHGNLIGIFGLAATPPNRFGEADVETMKLLSRHAAIAIHNANRYRQEQLRTGRFALLARVAGILNAGLDLDTMLQRAADTIHEVLDFPNVDIALLHPEMPDSLVVQTRGGAFRDAIEGEDILPIGGSVMGAAVRDRTTQRVDDVHADPRYTLTLDVDVPGAQLAVPMVAGNEVLGVLSVEGPEPFPDLDAVSLEIIADHLATSIANARLAEIARKHAIVLEREQLAYDLHDSVTQTLASINLLVQSLPLAWRRDAREGEKRAIRLQALSQTASTEMREMLARLHPDTEHDMVSKRPPASLATEIAELCRQLVPEGISVASNCSRWQPQQQENEDALLRVCREALCNAVRHARAGHIEVIAEVDELHACLTVRDDGCGLPPLARHEPGIGLRSMRSRINACGGELQLRSRIPRGTAVEAILPREDRKP